MRFQHRSAIALQPAVVVLVAMVSLSVAMVGVASAASPQTTINAVVVKSYSGCSSGGVIWDSLNANWSAYGSIPVHIDYSVQPLCDSKVTYSALVASGADVVIISDAAGGGYAYSAAEITALRRYAHDGHNLIATYVSFYWSGYGIDNGGLLPLFGLQPATTFQDGEQAVHPTYQVYDPTSPLFRNVPNPYTSSGYPYSQVPIDGLWNGNETLGATAVARTADWRAVISVGSAALYSAIYISTMPEYGGGTNDQQFFYNAIIYPQTG